MNNDKHAPPTPPAVYRPSRKQRRAARAIARSEKGRNERERQAKIAHHALAHHAREHRARAESPPPPQPPLPVAPEAPLAPTVADRDTKPQNVELNPLEATTNDPLEPVFDPLEAMAAAIRARRA